MCGIAGWYRRAGRPVHANVIKAQCDAIRHRGPDDRGIFVDDDLGFGMQRLSVVDVETSRQPMTSADGRYVVVFNGEIYNHESLRISLREAGYRFRTRGDTETVVAGFQLWGDAVWAQVEGMFAVAVWDRHRRTLTLARDPLGIKPLFLTCQEDGIAFASEMKALRLLPAHRFSIDERAVADYFRFGHVRQPRSIFSEVQVLRPGHVLTIGPEGGTREWPFWQPRFKTVADISAREWTLQMQAMLLETTRRHMQSDGPVGAFLSGGIDSSAILAAMTRVAGGGPPIKTFTIGYPGAPIDESLAAREIAAHLGAENQTIPLSCANVVDALPGVFAAFDEPFADMAAVPTWLASQRAATEVKVVLCGEGGDELFAGYKRHRNAVAIERHRMLAAFVRPAAMAAARLPTGGSVRLNRLRQHVHRANEFFSLPDGYPQFFAATQMTSNALRLQVLERDFRRRMEHCESVEELEQEYFAEDSSGANSALEKFLHADLSLNMPSAMLTRLDRASMAHSLEARVPFLSHKLVDWALTVPASLKIRDRTGKIILREAIRTWLPPSIYRRPKQGFQMPLGEWFRGPLGDYARSAWQDSRADLASYLDLRGVEKAFEAHRRGDADHSRILYAAMAFAHWRIALRSTAMELVA